MRMLISTVTLALAFASSSEAGALAPTKASQLLTIYASGSCAIGGTAAGNSTAFSQIVRADGTVGAFTIPAKQVFVITEATLTTTAEPAGDAMLSFVAFGTASGGSPVAIRLETVASNGTVNSSFLFPSGIALKGTATACAEMFNQTHGGSVFISATAHGFFAPDK